VQLGGRWVKGEGLESRHHRCRDRKDEYAVDDGLPMTIHPSQIQSPPQPPLESGDRLSRAEFEHRYTTATAIKKAELVEGIVYVASPLRFSPHAEPHSRLSTWLGTYAAFTAPYVLSGIEPTLRLDNHNEPQPDLVLRLDERWGGRSTLAPDGYLEGTPELVAEIAASSVAIDRGDKKTAYCRNGIQEYIIWNAYDNQLEWLHLVNGVYQPLPLEDGNLIRSQVFPGLWLAVDDLLTRNMPQVLTVLQAGLRFPECQTWIQQVCDRATSCE
jgi:Uma2 family endonuclease